MAVDLNSLRRDIAETASHGRTSVPHNILVPLIDELEAARRVVSALKDHQGELMHVPFISKVFESIHAYDKARAGEGE